VVLAVLVHDIVDHLAAAIHAEVHIDIGEGHTFRIQKPLEEQAVDERIQIRDAQCIGDEAACSRTASRPDGNTA
jgi:hypothetical protein